MADNHIRSPERRGPAHNPILGHPTNPIVVFLTVCSTKRRAIFDNHDASAVLLGAWRAAEAWQVGRYVIMPDHVHLFCSPVREEFSLEQWVGYWKSLASRRWRNPGDKPIWQRDFWDTQLRQGERYAQKWEYVRANPVRHGLVAQPDDWPFQGEINQLSWG